MVKSSNADTLTTPTSSGTTNQNDSCGRSVLIQSMYADSSGSYLIEQERARKNRPKPPPPVKPATLKNKIAFGSTQSSAPQTSRLDVSVVDRNLPSSNPVDSSEIVICSDKGKATCICESIATNSDPSFEATGTTGALRTEEFSGGEGEPSNLESTARSHSATTITNKPTSFINEEIKKPKIKPPPPPAQSPQRSSQSVKDSNRIKAIRKKLNLESAFDTNQNDLDGNENGPLTAHRFERYLDSLHIPSVPSIPPPSPPVPVLSPQDSVNDGMYEEIEQLTCAEKNEEIDETVAPDEQISRVLMQHENCDKSGQIGCYVVEEESDSINGCLSGNHSGATLRKSDEEKYYVKKNETDVTANKKAIAVRRPRSALEFDKLLRIKSDIQLNITKKVGQIKFKVSSASQEKQRCKRLSSISYTDREKLKGHNDNSIMAQIDFALDEQCIYGDVWSSDDDDYFCTAGSNSFNQGESQSDEMINTGMNAPNKPYSMLSEIEHELRLRFQAHDNLPDIVLESKRRSMSADPLPNDCASSTLRDCKHIQEDSYSGCCQPKADRSKPATVGYETIISSTPPSPEYNCLPSTSSDYISKEIDRSVYTARLVFLSAFLIIPDPQPLYQIYMMEQNGQLTYETDEQEIIQPTFPGKNTFEMERAASTASTDSGRGADCSTTMSQLTPNTSMRRDRLVASSHFASQRSLWCELPEVKSAGLLERLEEDTKKLQEAYFEVITSEASYLRSINILITHFMAAPEMLGSKRPSSVITNEERKQLFSNIFAVRDCSEKLLSDLENRLQESLVLSDVCDILCDHFETNFDPYIKYCSNQVYQDRTLRKLKSENSSFLSCIQRLENDRLCQGLDMRSFLMLPMQRVTRYPLLMIAILEHTQHDAIGYQTAQIALHLANHIVTCCNEGARHMERTEQLLEIERRLIYKSSDLRRIPLISSGRYLVKRGSLTCLNEKRSKKLLNTRQQFRSIYIFLFSDIIMLTKKKVNGTYICKDYSARKFVDIEPVEINDPKLLQSMTVHIPLKKPHLFICTLMHNAVGKQVELLLNADSETDRERWLSALRPPACTNPEEKIYADWDCPQAVAVHQYSPNQEDELPLEKGDLINILRKMPDGWFYGERVRDLCSGWFPSSYVQQVLNDHVRAKNYRRRLRVIQAAAELRFRQRQMKLGTEENTCRLMERFRRLSNTKTSHHGLKLN
ncbi:unnamed protein product [Litomosoides sigmodontis]|uniref:DH domain-containing protein n=1 Tax=Litomosoides sigmodontis TaxID=42156 RepID=A0A3P6TD02_LITSI|nr:unnamed protein product [Litomosoides sigmodontis]